MNKNFCITNQERNQILEQHKRYGYRSKSLNEDNLSNNGGSSQPCFNMDYLRTIVTKNGFKVSDTYCPTFSQGDPNTMARNKQLMGKGKQSCFEIDGGNKFLQYRVEILGKDPNVLYVADFPNDYGKMSNIISIAEKNGFRVEGDKTYLQVYLEKEVGKELQCGNYQQFSNRVARLVQLREKLGPDFKRPATMSSSG